jgi:ABC-2 type transport system ATP-binding protein
MIETACLTKLYGSKVALDSLSFRVEPGTIFGFLGPNGAGKSTTVKVLTGLLRPTRGKAQVAGFDVVEQPLDVKSRLGYVPETGALYESLSPAEYLELVACLHHLDARTAKTRMDELLDLFGILDVKHQRMTEFSKGMKQKVLVSAALIHKPDVLFLDEPLNGLDANAAMIFKELLKKLAAQGKMVLFCSHILEVVERICTRILIINEGKAIIEGTAKDICDSTGSDTLEQAFAHLTGSRDAGQVTTDFLAALDRAGAAVALVPAAGRVCQSGIAFFSTHPQGPTIEQHDSYSGVWTHCGHWVTVCILPLGLSQYLVADGCAGRPDCLVVAPGKGIAEMGPAPHGQTPVSRLTDSS